MDIRCGEDLIVVAVCSQTIKWRVGQDGGDIAGTRCGGDWYIKPAGGWHYANVGTDVMIIQLRM